MTDAPESDPVLDLYTVEVSAAAAALADGLAVLAADPRQTAPLDSLDKAAKRAKAAALIVGRADVADVARRLEAAFSQARGGELTAERVAELQAVVATMTAETSPPGPLSEVERGSKRAEVSHPHRSA